MDETTTILASVTKITHFAVIDALATIPGNLAFIVPFLASRRPLLTLCAYTSGVFLGGILSGIVVALGFHEAGDWIGRNIDGFHQSGTLLGSLQALIGLALIIWGAVLLGRRPVDGPEVSPSKKRRTTSIVIGGAFLVALMSMFIRLPTALPYLATVGRLHEVPSPATMKLLGLVYHNLVLIAPLVLLLFLFRVAPTHGERIVIGTQRWIRQRGRTVIAICLITVGAVLTVHYIGHRASRFLEGRADREVAIYQSSVRNGMAGKPSLLYKFAPAGFIDQA